MSEEIEKIGKTPDVIDHTYNAVKKAGEVYQASDRRGAHRFINGFIGGIKNLFGAGKEIVETLEEAEKPKELPK